MGASMSEEKKKQWLVTLPYDDVRGMEERSELLEIITNDLKLLKGYKFICGSTEIRVDDMLEKISATAN